MVIPSSWHAEGDPGCNVSTEIVKLLPQWVEEDDRSRREAGAKLNSAVLKRSA
jgi:hypothetical protein